MKPPSICWSGLSVRPEAGYPAWKARAFTERVFLWSNPVAKLKPLDEWGVDNEVLSPAVFLRLLRVVQGLEGPRDSLERTHKYKGLFPFLVLAGLQGLRAREMIRERTKDPVIEWQDFLWKQELIVVRDEVAKQTRSRNRLRYVPLETATIELLR